MPATRRVVTGATLLGGLPSREAVESLCTRVHGPDVEHLRHLPRFLHWLYPGRDEAGRQAAWVSGLEPDLLGEALVARVLGDPDTPQGYLEQVLVDGGEAGLRNAFVVLGRIALWNEPHGGAWLTRLLEGDALGRAASTSTPLQQLQALAAAANKLAADFGNWKTPWGEINRFQRLTGDIAIDRGVAEKLQIQYVC